MKAYSIIADCLFMFLFKFYGVRPRIFEPTLVDPLLYCFLIPNGDLTELHRLPLLSSRFSSSNMNRSSPLFTYLSLLIGSSDADSYWIARFSSSTLSSSNGFKSVSMIRFEFLDGGIKIDLFRMTLVGYGRSSYISSVLNSSSGEY